MSALHLLERAASAWATWGSARAVDGLLALAAAGIVWLFLRGRVSPHAGSALFLLCFVPLVLPVSKLPSRLVARALPRARIEAALARWLASEDVVANGPDRMSASGDIARDATVEWAAQSPTTTAGDSAQCIDNLDAARNETIRQAKGRRSWSSSSSHGAPSWRRSSRASAWPIGARCDCSAGAAAGIGGARLRPRGAGAKQSASPAAPSLPSPARRRERGARRSGPLWLAPSDARPLFAAAPGALRRRASLRRPARARPPAARRSLDRRSAPSGARDLVLPPDAMGRRVAGRTADRARMRRRGARSPSARDRPRGSPCTAQGGRARNRRRDALWAPSACRVQAGS
jgi:hypothetical protein